MATVTFLLEDWEHWCCGERRAVGDDIDVRVHRSDHGLYETRHTLPGDDFADVISGWISRIAWRRAIISQDDGGLSSVSGYEAGVPLTTTDDRGDDDEDIGALEFTLETASESAAP